MLSGWAVAQGSPGLDAERHKLSTKLNCSAKPLKSLEVAKPGSSGTSDWTGKLRWQRQACVGLEAPTAPSLPRFLLASQAGKSRHPRPEGAEGEALWLQTEPKLLVIAASQAAGVRGRESAGP